MAVNITFEDKETKLTYDQQVFVMKPGDFHCSVCVPNPKVVAGKIKGFNNDKYDVLINYANNNVEVCNSVCVVKEDICCGEQHFDVNGAVYNCNSNAPKIISIEPENLFVLGLNDRNFDYTNNYGTFNIKINDIVKVYPSSKDYKVISFNNDFSKVLVVDMDKENAYMDMTAYRVVDLSKEFIITNVINSTIPYTYKVQVEE